MGRPPGTSRPHEPGPNGPSTPAETPSHPPSAPDGAASGPRPNGSDGQAGSLRHAILVRLRQAGPATPDALASDLGASRTGVLGQLRHLEEAGLVGHEPERHGVGRPRHRYDLTDEAQALFPSAYDGLARGLLAAIRLVGGDDLVEDVFEVRRREIAERASRHLDDRLNGDRSPGARARELAVFQDAHGYLADSITGPDGAVRVRQHNCAIHDVAAAEPAACEAELRLFREVLGADVVRESHIASGDRACVYRIGDGNGAAEDDARP